MKKCVLCVLAVSLILAWGLNSAIGAEKVLKLGASVCLTDPLDPHPVTWLLIGLRLVNR